MIKAKDFLAVFGCTLNQTLVKNSIVKDGAEISFVYLQGQKEENPRVARAIIFSLNGKYVDAEVTNGKIADAFAIDAPPPTISSEDLIGDFSQMSITDGWNIVDKKYLIGQNCVEV